MAVRNTSEPNAGAKPASGRGGQGELFNMLTELYRLDCALWGHPLDAAILRCIAVSGWKDGRAAKVRGIAHTLNVGVATVHDRLQKLQRRTDPDTGEPRPLVQRAHTGGYELTERADGELADSLRTIAETIARFARRHDGCAICQTAAGPNRQDRRVDATAREVHRVS